MPPKMFLSIRFLNISTVCSRNIISNGVVAALLVRRKFSTQNDSQKVTALYDFHVENGGKIVNFGGYLLPVQYHDLGITASHLHTRKAASLFDVSHMLQTEIIGKRCIECLESICTADLLNLPINQSVLTVFTNACGGILDDLIITKLADNHLYIVSNAAMKDQDQRHMRDSITNYNNTSADNNNQITIKFFDPQERSLLALQGPKSAAILQKLTDHELSRLAFMQSTQATVCGVDSCRITRCGYTGEDGFELSIPSIKSVDIAREILRDSSAKLAGLGARDSLRLESGLCLYGNDITAETTPVEAGLTWLVAKSRRTRQNFPGAAVILQQIQDGASNNKIKRRVGLIASGGPPARHGAKILHESDDNVELGDVTSGCPAPSLAMRPIAMGYVPKSHSKIGTKLMVRIRERNYEWTVTKMPFVPANYYKVTN